MREALATLRADPDGENAEPPPPPPPPAPASAPDPSLAIRQQILTRAASLLGLPYVWGGNNTRTGMDCSAYVSWVWGTSRHTTDSIWAVSHFIGKADLRAGDVMNLTIGRDPQRRGHIRIFEAWANEAKTLMWVYEETPPRVVHRVIAYDDRYQPIRLDGLSSAGAAMLVPAPASAPERVSPSSGGSGNRGVQPTPRRTPAPTAQPAVRPTARPTAAPTARPTATPRPTITAGAVLKTPSPTLRPATARPTAPVRTATPVG